jgi:hypothetical protein
MYNIEYLLLHGALLIKSMQTSPMDLITAESESDADCCSPGLLVFAKALSYTYQNHEEWLTGVSAPSILQYMIVVWLLMTVVWFAWAAGVPQILRTVGDLQKIT